MRNIKEKRKETGFTLIELLIVVGLVGVLAAAMLVILDPIGQFQKSQDARRKSDLAEIQKGLNLYYQDTGRYPPSTLDYRISVNGSPVSWNGAWLPYMAKLPADPTSTKKYIYYVPDPTGQTYYLYASLDRGATDKQACNSGSACTSVTAGPGNNACGGTCNFGVSSPNVTP